ncbi:MAG: nuclear transport factor 2 family protein [Saprospiraceae bacterium]|nr:nuclear transport factor 2 family protein [Saprospiraceae bacterium]
MRSFIFLFICPLVLLTPLKGQTSDALLHDTISQLDFQFWECYNRCDVQGMSQFLQEDLEFYHDKAGPLSGKSALVESLKKNLCTEGGYRLRREAIEGSLEIYPMKQNNEIYGAIISGMHVFYITEGERGEVLDGKARFSHLWILEKGRWVMSRLLSYDHGPAPKHSSKPVYPISEAGLKKFEGNYESMQVGEVSVKADKDRLLLKVQGGIMYLYPAGEMQFFVKDQATSFTFETVEDGKIGGIVIEESGVLADYLRKL